MTAPQHKSVRTFTWLSGGLFLAVIGLGLGGLLLLRQDRQQATRDAETLAQALADSLTSKCSAQIRQAVERYLNDVEGASGALHRVACGAPTDGTNDAGVLARFPIATLRSLPRARVYLMDSRKTFTLEIPDAPQPPEWMLHTPSDLLKRWEALEDEALRSGKMPNATATFQRDISGRTYRPLQANLQFLFARLAEGSRDEKAQRLVGFAANDDDTTLSGVRLGDLAMLRAVDQAESEKVLAGLLARLVSTGFHTPTFLTERVLEKFSGRVVADFPALSNRLEAARVLWEMDQVTRPILKACRDGGWRSSGNVGEFLVFTQNSTTIETNIVVDHSFNPPVTNIGSVGPSTAHWVKIVPVSVVDAALQTAANEVSPRWPDYLSAKVELFDRRFGVTPGALGVTHRWDSQPLLATKVNALNGSLPTSLFTVSVRLRDPDALHAKQRQRLFFFGVLIVATTVIGVFGVWQLKQNLSAQVRLNEQKSNFVSSVSHELRAPIASVRLMAESLERGKISEPAKQNEYFRFIGQECRRLSSLIENVLDFSRIEQGRKQYEFEPTDIGALVEQTVKLMAPYAAEKGVRLSAECGVRSAELNVDGRAIQQALVNLIDNAIKHSPTDATVTVSLATANADSESRNPNPEIRIEDEGRERGRGGAELRVTRHPPLVILSVTDHGPGIPASEHERIFERFYRLGSELRRETPGVGIGLSIVKHVVEAHGGRVRVASEVGQGSRFTIELPVETTEAQS